METISSLADSMPNEFWRRLSQRQNVDSEYEKQRTRDGGKDEGKQRNKGQEQWNRATEEGALGQLKGVRGRRNEDGRQGTDHVRQGTEDGRQGTETSDRGHRTGDKAAET